MSPLAEKIPHAVPGLRRYACALTGNRRSDDWWVRVVLEVCLQERSCIRDTGDVKFQLYKLFGEALSVFRPAPAEPIDETGHDGRLKQGIGDLPLLSRQLLMLVTLEGLSVRRAASLFGMSEREAETHLGWARRKLRGRADRRTACPGTAPDAPPATKFRRAARVMNPDPKGVSPAGLSMRISIGGGSVPRPRA